MKGHWIGIFTSKDNETEINFTSVSYTHLDVYKRQNQHRAIAEEIILKELIYI